MGWLAWVGFGPRTKVTAKDNAILDLKLQRDRIRQYQKRIAIVQQREHALARQCLQKGDKKRALLFLRKEKFQKQLLSRTDEQLASLEELVASIEFAQIQRDVVFGLEQGASILKEINAEMSIERVEKIMDDSAEGIAYQQEVEAMLSERITNADETEIRAELELLEMQALGGKVEAMKPPTAAPPLKHARPARAENLPGAPTTSLSRPVEVEADREANYAEGDDDADGQIIAA